jgi:hypothetical protein
MANGNVPPSETTPSKSSTPEKFDIAALGTTAVNRLGDAFMSLPIWARICALSVTLCGVGVLLFIYYFPQKTAVAVFSKTNPQFLDKAPAMASYLIASIEGDGHETVTAILKLGTEPAGSLVGTSVVVVVPSDSSFNGVFPVRKLSKAENGAWALSWKQPGQSNSAEDGTISTAPYAGGTFAPENQSGSAQNVEAGDKAKEDEAAISWHYPRLGDDSGDEKSITPKDTAGHDADPDNYIHFRFYSKSDKCVEILRKEGGEHYPSQWIKDPRYHRHDTHNASVDPDQNHPAWTRPAEALAFVQSGELFPFQKLEMKPVQGFCINPHPGNFRYWWGQPIDACNSPMYRQFGDGCTHYQIYNRCANAWDPQIYWTYCHPPPHG